MVSQFLSRKKMGESINRRKESILAIPVYAEKLLAIVIVCVGGECVDTS